MSAPKERPIIFSGAMVRAILDGRKTMTRRILKPQPQRFMVNEGDGERLCDIEALHVEGDPWPRVRLGRVITRQEIRFAIGQQLWVREAFSQPNDQVTIYRANWREDAIARGLDNVPAADAGIRWRPSIHMPRWASRITLRVTAVKVERLQEISEEDAIAEGIWDDTLPDEQRDWWKTEQDATPGEGWRTDDPRLAFRALWENIHGAGAWEANPTVVAISFKRLDGGVLGRRSTGEGVNDER